MSEKELLEVGDYGELSIEQVLGMVDISRNPVRACWDGADLRGPDAETMAGQIMAAGRVVKEIVAYPDGQLHGGCRRTRGMARLLMYPGEHGIDTSNEEACAATLAGITARLIVIPRGDEREDLKSAILDNGSVMGPADYIVSYRNLMALDASDATPATMARAIGELLGHGPDQAKLYGVLAESAPEKLIEAIAAGRVQVGSLRNIANFPPEERDLYFARAAEIGAAPAEIERAKAKAESDSPDGQVPAEVAERIEKAERKVDEDRHSGRNPEATQRDVAALLHQGREEAPHTLARIRENLVSHASPENPIAYVLLGMYDGYTADPDKAQFWAAMANLMKEGSVATSARGVVVKLLNNIAKLRKQKVAAATAAGKKSAPAAKKEIDVRNRKKNPQKVKEGKIAADGQANRRAAKAGNGKAAKVAGGSVAKAKASPSKKKAAAAAQAG